MLLDQTVKLHFIGLSLFNVHYLNPLVAARTANELLGSACFYLQLNEA